MTRDKALKILAELRNSPKMVKHALACEAAMRALLQKVTKESKEPQEPKGLKDTFGPSGPFVAFGSSNIDDWALVGLLHDADYEATNKSLETHTDLVTEKLNGKVSQEVIDAIRGHCDKAPRHTFMSKAIYAADELTGLIVATALVMPDKKLLSVTVESVLKKFKEKSFAAGANREQIKTCETELNIPLPEFVGIILKSMQEISNDLGL